jgi:tRNA (guanine-N7-)-methyltransferase
MTNTSAQARGRYAGARNMNTGADSIHTVQRRAIRSFGVRAGRMGSGQARTLAELGPRFGLP